MKLLSLLNVPFVLIIVALIKNKYNFFYLYYVFYILNMKFASLPPPLLSHALCTMKNGSTPASIVTLHLSLTGTIVPRHLLQRWDYIILSQKFGMAPEKFG